MIRVPDDQMSQSGVYCIHFSKKVGHARHYTGYADCIASRVLVHALTVCTPPENEGESWKKDGTGSKLLGVLNFLGIKWNVSRVWVGKDRTFERQLKRQGHAAVYCPECSGQRAYNRMRGDE